MVALPLGDEDGKAEAGAVDEVGGDVAEDGVARLC